MRIIKLHQREVFGFQPPHRTIAPALPEHPSSIKLPHVQLAPVLLRLPKHLFRHLHIRLPNIPKRHRSSVRMPIPSPVPNKHYPPSRREHTRKWHRIAPIPIRLREKALIQKMIPKLYHVASPHEGLCISFTSSSSSCISSIVSAKQSPLTNFHVVMHLSLILVGRHSGTPHFS